MVNATEDDFLEEQEQEEEGNELISLLRNAISSNSITSLPPLRVLTLVAHAETLRRYCVEDAVQPKDRFERGCANHRASDRAFYLYVVWRDLVLLAGHEDEEETLPMRDLFNEEDFILLAKRARVVHRCRTRDEEKLRWETIEWIQGILMDFERIPEEVADPELEEEGSTSSEDETEAQIVSQSLMRSISRSPVKPILSSQQRLPTPPTPISNPFAASLSKAALEHQAKLKNDRKVNSNRLPFKSPVRLVQPVVENDEEERQSSPEETQTQYITQATNKRPRPSSASPRMAPSQKKPRLASPITLQDQSQVGYDSPASSRTLASRPVFSPKIAVASPSIKGDPVASPAPKSTASAPPTPAQGQQLPPIASSSNSGRLSLPSLTQTDHRSSSQSQSQSLTRSSDSTSLSYVTDESLKAHREAVRRGNVQAAAAVAATRVAQTSSTQVFTQAVVTQGFSINEEEEEEEDGQIGRAHV